MKILVIQNRMGIGDTVIFLPFIEAISKKYNIPVNLMVRENSKADQYLYETNYIDKILILDRNNKSNGKHDGFLGAINLANDLKKNKFDKVFIFNSSLRFKLISKLAGIKDVYQYPLFKKENQHIIDAAKNFIKDSIGVINFNDPRININENKINDGPNYLNIKKKEINILLGIGGSGPTKRIPSKTFLRVVEEITKFKKCNFFLATGKNDEEQIILKEILNTKFSNLFTSLDNLTIKETLPIIKSCDVSICNDTSYSHLSAALGINTITLMADTPLIYGSYSSKMHPIIPDGDTTVTHNTRGKDNISPNKIIEKLKLLLN
jgi:heptosyltransferase II